mgnify:CR=1 FL=1
MATSKPFISSSFTYETLEETLDVKPRGAELFIGIPKETSFSENRIALTPEAVSVMVANGHRGVVETKAGAGSSYSDKDYSEAGAKIAYDRKEVYEADILVKSAPVSEAECDLLKYGQFIISPIHLAVMKSEILRRPLGALTFQARGTDSLRTVLPSVGEVKLMVAGADCAESLTGLET